MFIDHHVPQGSPESATVLSGSGMDPVPTSSLASGGALRPADWNAFVRSLGFGAEMEVTA
jgi:hypothetical protein